jgi:hypothetical protein
MGIRRRSALCVNILGDNIFRRSSRNICDASFQLPFMLGYTGPRRPDVAEPSLERNRWQPMRCTQLWMLYETANAPEWKRGQLMVIGLRCTRSVLLLEASGLPGSRWVLSP